MGLSFAKRLCFTKMIDFSKIRCKIVQYFNLVHAHKTKFGIFAIIRSQFFFLGPLLFSSALLHSLPFGLHILSGCCKKLGVNYGQNLEMDLDQL